MSIDPDTQLPRLRRAVVCRSSSLGSTDPRQDAPTHMNPLVDFRRFYAEFIVKSSGGAADNLIDAFAAVPREEFLGPGPWQVFVGSGYIPSISDDPRLLYQDMLIALAPERRINNGQPSLHARCLTAAAPATGETVVHVGAGTGYYSAILACLVGATGKVIAIEREEDLAARARAALRPYLNVEVRAESATEAELPESDLIYVSAGATHPPAAWLDALRIGGRLVLPLTTNEGFGVMLLVTRKGASTYAASAFSRVAFIPCIGARDDATSAALAAALERQSLRDVRSLQRNTSPDSTAWCIGANWWLSTAESRSHLKTIGSPTASSAM
jgi:protein-L-isoaspartate(D-aspartate) O-methyltransferase